MTSIVWMSEPLSNALCKRISSDTTIVTSVEEFLDARRDASTVSFIDASTLAELDRHAAELGVPTDDLPPPAWRKLVAAVSVGPVTAICNEPIRTAILWLQPHPWLSHVVSSSALEQPTADAQLAHLLQTVTASGPPDWLGRSTAGRRIRLTHASKRVDRLKKMSEFFASEGVHASTVEMLRDAADEMLVNAFYNAPVAAGAVTTPISRQQDVALPDDAPCDMVYGFRDDLALVRVRDPFGSLTRRRLVEVLSRCASPDLRIEPADKTSGEGVGLWRLFSNASFVAVSVVENRQTEVLVGFGKQPPPGRRPFAFHLLFKEGARRRFWHMADEDTGDASHTRSITVLPD